MTCEEEEDTFRKDRETNLSLRCNTPTHIYMFPTRSFEFVCVYSLDVHFSQTQINFFFSLILYIYWIPVEEMTALRP
jgi:hypothetical protein